MSVVYSVILAVLLLFPSAGHSDEVLVYPGGWAAQADTAPFNWAPFLTAVWYMEQDGTNARVDSASGNCSGPCNLTAIATIARSATKMEGDFAATMPGTTYMESQRDELDVSSTSTSLTWGCWARPVASTKMTIISKEDGSNDGFFSERRVSTTRLACKVDETVDLSATSTMPDNTYVHAVCRFSHVNDTIDAFTNAATDGSTSESDIGTTTTEHFRVGTDSVTAGDYFSGQLDECFYTKTALTDASICRICSCGVSGDKCTCDNGDLTAYVTKGDWTTCGSCTLPNCNTASPATI